MNSSQAAELEPWIAVDLDGTLAENEFDVKSPLHVGPPVPAMVERVKRWLREGKQVKVFTARVYKDTNEYSVHRIREAIQAWCLQHVGAELEVTNVKDYAMLQIWDDRAVCVQENTGKYLCFTENGKVLNR